MRSPKQGTNRSWAIVLAGQTIRLVPYTGPDQDGLLAWCMEGDAAWKRVAHVVTISLKNKPKDEVEV